MDKKIDLTENFDCVEMKHKAAKIISQKLSKMTREEELAYWHEKTLSSHLKLSKSKKTPSKV